MHRIFLVHGMGETDGWHDAVEATLSERFNGYEPPIPFNKCYKVEKIDYNSVFSEYLEEWKDQQKRFQLLSNADRLTRNELVQAVLGAAQTEITDSPIFTHLADVLLYTATHKQDQVISLIQQTMEQKLADGDTYSIIAHSLGTRVMHDVLQSESTRPRVQQAFGKPICLLQIANVTRLAGLLIPGDAYHSQVYPSMFTDKGACYFYVSVDHPLDPFTWPRPFRPPADWPPGDENVAELFFNVSIQAQDIVDWNTHGVENYLANPLTTKVFFNKTYPGPRLRDILIDDSRLAKAYQDYRKTTLVQKTVAQMDKFISEVETLARGSFDNWAEIVKMVKKFEGLIKRFANGNGGEN